MVETRRSLVRRFVHYVAAAALLVSFMVLGWHLFVVRWHMLPVVRGEMGLYGNIELPDLIGPRTVVHEFSAVRLPSRVAQTSVLTVPFGESIHVTVVYSEPGGARRTWDKTYLIGCSVKGACLPLRLLSGVGLYGASTVPGQLEARQWAYLLGPQPTQQPTHQPEHSVPGLPPRQPSVVPLPHQEPQVQPLPPGTTIA